MDSSPCLSEMPVPKCDGLSNSSGIRPAYNPFEVDICSLSLPACSPDAFSITKKRVPEEEEPNSDTSFRWSIGQVAMLKPADLDEESHQTSERWDEEKEFRAQKAIQTFFLHNSVCPSPWNGAMNFKHVTFSPHLASTKYYSRSNSPFTGSRESSETVGKRDVWTQTTLAIPTEIDIFQLLGHFFTFMEEQREQRLNEEIDCTNDAKDLSNSSLRRKLFSPNSLHKDHSSDCGSIPLAISPLKFCTPEKVPLCEFQPSPSSAGTHFSSSPIYTKKCSISPALMERNPSSPSVSPILTEKQQKSSTKGKEVNSQIKWIPSTPCTKKGVRLKSIQNSILGDEFVQSMEKGSSRASTVSMVSKGCSEEFNRMEDLQMDADNMGYDSLQNSDMQVSVVQFSSDEKVCTQSAGVSGFHPSSAMSQDTGYKTESYQFSLENGTSANINESKEKMVHNWLSRDCDINDKGIADEVEHFQLRQAEVVDYMDSVLMSQSNWHPCGFSTPHRS